MTTILPQISGARARFRDVSQDWRTYSKIRRKEGSAGKLKDGKAERGRSGKGNLCTERAALEGLSCRTSGLAAEDKDHSPLVEPQNPQDPSAAKDPRGRIRGGDFGKRAREDTISLSRRETD